MVAEQNFLEIIGKSKKSILEEYLERYEKGLWNYRKIDSGIKNKAHKSCLLSGVLLTRKYGFIWLRNVRNRWTRRV